MEFVQFHPTSFCQKNQPSFLISEAVRGAGAHIINKENNRFVFNFSPKGELATRDIVSNAIVNELSKDKVKTDASTVFLDMRPLGKKKLKKNFPNILKACLQAGINPITTPVPIAPAAHYFMGGIKTDINGITSVNNLYAIGESSCTGLHGANRLASNSLLEAGVMALNLAKHINKDASTMETHREDNIRLSLFPLPLNLCIPTNIHKTKELLFQYAGPMRNEKGLTKLAQYLNNEATHTSTLTRENIEAANMLTIAKLVTSFALERKESRGAHLRSDYPQLDQNNFQAHKQTSITEIKMLPEAIDRVANMARTSSDMPVKIQSVVR
jgi:L-aspartate oxidase